MIIEKQERVIHTGGLQEKGGFKIAATAHMQQILSDGMYSDKIKAVIREVSCNALDAHTKVGNLDPIQVNLPTMLSPEFMVKDYGPGLSHEAVMELYTTYGHSDKGTSNELIGGLGLGSKSPFAYTDQFVIESRYNGKMRMYSCFKDGEGMMQIALLATHETEEANGLTIKVSVKHSDISAFKEKAYQVYKFFPTKPKLNTTMLFEDEPIMEGANWKLYHSNRDVLHIQMGAVGYPVMPSNFDEGVLSDAHKSLLGRSFVIQVPIGSVQIAASRESLSYTKNTQATLVKVLDKVMKEVVEGVQDSLDKEPYLLKAYMTLSKIVGDSKLHQSIATIIGVGAKYKGIGIREHYKNHKLMQYHSHHSLSSHCDKVCIKELSLVDWSKNKTVFTEKRKRRESYHFNNNNTINSPFFTPEYLSNVVWIEKDEGGAWQQKIIQWADGTSNIVVIEETEDNGIDLFLKSFGLPRKELLKLSSLPKPTFTRTSSGPKGLSTPVKLKVVSGYEYLDVDKDITEGGVYFKMYNGSAVDGNYETRQKILSIGKYILNPETVYGIQGTHHKALERNQDKWKDLDTYLEECKEEARKRFKSDERHYKRYCALNNTVTNKFSSQMKKFLTCAKEVGILSTNKNYIATMKLYTEYLNLKDKYGSTLETFLELHKGSTLETFLELHKGSDSDSEVDVPVTPLEDSLGLFFQAAGYGFIDTSLTKYAAEVKLILDNAKGN